MESKQNLKVIQEAINQLLLEEEEEAEDGGASIDDRRTLLSDLRSELEQEEKCRGDEIIMKELNDIKRQNLITQGLVSAMILVTLTWQLSEVSLILKIKHVLSSPLESLGGIAKRFFNGQSNVNVNVQQVMQQASSSIKDKVSFQSPSIKFPYLEEEEEEDDEEQE